MYRTLIGASEPQPDATLTRAMKVEHFMDLLTTGELYISRLDKFKDRSEFAVDRSLMDTHVGATYRRSFGRTQKSLLMGRCMHPADYYYEQIDLMYRRMMLIKRHYHTCCFTVKDPISTRLWNDKFPGVAIRLRYADLVEQLDKMPQKSANGELIFAGGLVTYDGGTDAATERMRGSEGDRLEHYAEKCLATKREFFEFEAEYRLAILPPQFLIDIFVSASSSPLPKPPPIARRVPIDLNTALVEVMVLCLRGSDLPGEVERKLRVAGLAAPVTVREHFDPILFDSLFRS